MIIRTVRQIRQFGLFWAILLFMISNTSGGTEHRIRQGGVERSFLLAEDQLLAGDRVITLDDRKSGLRGLRDAARARAAAGTGPVALVLYEQGAKRDVDNAFFLSDQVLIEYTDENALDKAVSLISARSMTKPDYAPGFAVLFTADALGSVFDATNELARLEGITVHGPLLHRKLSPRYTPQDPLFPAQWHLRNTGQNSLIQRGLDIRVTNAWAWGYTGEGVVIGVVDDGLDYRHPDLAPNYRADLSRNWNGYPGGINDPLPAAFNYESHGTAVAGVAAGRWNNNEGISGVAPLASLAGLRLIAQPAVGDLEESQSAAHRNNAIAIKNNSWGPQCGDGLSGPGVLMAQALAASVTQGRGGLGTIHVWAGGNEREDCEEDANTDGYANSIYTISVAAIGNDGRYASYSDPGACHVVSSPGSDGDMVTTYNLDEGDFPGETDYTGSFNGTSSAAPVVSGVIALMLQANPALGWRDVQEILIRSARKIDPNDSDWANNAAGFHFNHNYGAGMVDASAAVAMAYDWQNLGEQQQATIRRGNLNRAIPDSCTPVEILFASDHELRIEHITVTVDIEHTYRGDLIIELTGPGGMRSTLARVRDDHGDDYPQWTFMTTRHWGESAAGNWRLTVADCASGDAGNIRSASMTIYGTADEGPEVVAPEPLAPTGIITNRTPVFSWTPGTRSLWHRVYLYRGTQTVFDTWTQSSSTYSHERVLRGGSYTWYVAGWDSAGQSPWSAAASFTIPLRLPSVIDIIQPSGQLEVLTPVFSWRQDDEATWYQLWVGDQAGAKVFSSWYAATAEDIMQVELTGFVLNRNYQWLVRGWGPDGSGPWSDPATFSTPDGKALLIDPSGSTTAELPLFTWTPAPGSTWYRVFVRRSSDRAAVLSRWTQDISLVAPDVFPGGDYMWWIGSWGPGFGGVVWSDPQSFQIP